MLKDYGIYVTKFTGQTPDQHNFIAYHYTVTKYNYKGGPRDYHVTISGWGNKCDCPSFSFDKAPCTHIAHAKQFRGEKHSMWASGYADSLI